MDANISIDNNYNNIFGVKHYKVKIIREKDNIFKYIVSVISYAIFVFLMLLGGTLLLYIADIKIRAAKGDYSAPVFNAYVVLSGSMLPSIEIKDVPNANILGKVILKIPKLGYIQDILSSKGGLIILVLIPCLAILSYDIMKILKRVGRKSKLIKE